MLKVSLFRVILVAVVLLGALLVMIPNTFDRQSLHFLPASIQQMQLRLGLDLQGGSSLLLEVDEDAVRESRMETLEGQVRTALRAEKLGYRGLQYSAANVRFTLRDDHNAEESERLLQREIAEVVVNRDGMNFTLGFSEPHWEAELHQIVEQTIEVIRRRVDETGTNEPTIQQQGRLRILVQLPGLDDPERLKNLLGRTAQMNFHLVDPRGLQGKRAFPGSLALPMADDGTLIAIERRVIVSGEHLEDSQATFQDNLPVVSFRFNQNGGQRFGHVTANNVNERLAIILDNTVISAPNIDEPILGGSGIIRGGFSLTQAQDLALLLRAGALPAPIAIIEERTVGPTLGADSLSSGKWAASVGLALVAALMIATYGLFGLLAIIALTVNLVLLMAMLSVLQATLTLPGLAGIALTIGMSVDANVLIFERVREELRNGKSPPASINSGFDKAFVTIIDANITTLIAAVCLYVFGLGAIRGFAVTLTFGIIASMFTAILLTRLMVVLWHNRVRPKQMTI
ncbi:MAG: protein translocase subunit SecD [Alphaproteobacteria bacterium]|nr:protein translocase subunit SecD [Alphaproteobacteria bacterium]